MPFAGQIRPWIPGAARGGDAHEKLGPVRAGVVPHHGLASETIARFYDSLPSDVERVILIGPDHFRAGRRSITLCPLPWQTGNVILETDAGAAAALARIDGVKAESLPFRMEHSIGLHIVFIGRYFPNAKVTALMVNNAASARELSGLVSVISKLLDEKTILILSMDFSHDKMPEEAKREDDKSIEQILSFNTEALIDLDIDAAVAARLFLDVLKNRGITDGVVLERTDSGEIIGNPEEPCTSYATILFR